MNEIHTCYKVFLCPLSNKDITFIPLPMTGETPRHIEAFVLNEVIWSIFTRLSFFFTGDFSIPYLEVTAC